MTNHLSLRTLHTWTQGLSGRERTWLILVLLATVGVLADFGAFGPQQQQTQALRAQAQAQRASIEALAGTIQQLASPHHAAQVSDQAAKRDALREEVRYAQALIQRAQHDVRIGAIARSLMAQMRGLTLRGLQTRPSQPFFKPKAPATPASAAAPAKRPPTPLPPLYLHATEVSVEGRYDEVVQFLRRLESLEQQHFWPSVTVQVTEPGFIQLRATVQTLSISPDAPLQ